MPVNLSQAQHELVGTWRVTVADDARARVLRVLGVAVGAEGSWLVDGVYGWEDKKGARVQAVVTQVDGVRRLALVTPADSTIVATQAAAGAFAGTMQTKGGARKPVQLERERETAVTDAPAATAATTATAAIAVADPGAPPPTIHLVVMGGDDCPPCAAWRALEFPKLQRMPAFQAIQYSFVIKAVRSPVPSMVFLPDAVKPYKAQLDEASSGRSGSPQAAVLVNGQIYDYYFGVRSASEIETMLLAIQGTGRYPFRRCLKVTRSRDCALRG